MRFKKNIAILLSFCLMLSLFACSKAKPDNDDDEIEETTEEVEETKMATPTPRPTSTPTPLPEPTTTPTPTPSTEEYEFISDVEAFEIYKAFASDYSEEHPDAIYLFDRIYGAEDLDATQFWIEVNEGSTIHFFRILRDSLEVELVIEYDESDFITYDELTTVDDDRFGDVSDIAEYMSTHLPNRLYQLGTYESSTNETVNVLIVRDEDSSYIDCQGYNSSVRSVAGSSYEGYTAEELVNFYAIPEYYYPIATDYTFEDGDCFGGVINISPDMENAWLIPAQPILWSGITDAGYDDEGNYYFVYNGNVYHNSDTNDDAYYFIGEYDPDFQNREGCVYGSSDIVLTIQANFAAMIPFAPDCEISFNGPWVSSYNDDDFFESTFTMDSDAWNEFISSHRCHALTEPATIEGNQITSIVLGTR